jgi:uncharacterized membrane protein YfcA
MTPAEVAIAVLAGFASGVLSGAFGIGGAILTTPAIQVLLGAPPLIAVGTPLPVIFPTTITGAISYHRAGHLDFRAVKWASGPGVVAAVGGALLTGVIEPHLLLLATALLLCWQAVSLARGRDPEPGAERTIPGPALAASGVAAGAVSGLLGVGGGIVLVPVLTWLGMPLRRAIGTSLVVITVLVIPGTIVHTALGHVDWAIAFALVVGVVPGARLGAHLAIRARDRTLRLVVGAFFGLIGVAYAALEVVNLLDA